MYSLLSYKFKIFAVGLMILLLFLGIKGNFYIHLGLIITFLAGYWTDSIKERVIEFNLENLWNKILLDETLIEVRGELNEYFTSTKRYDQLIKDPNVLGYNEDYKIKRLFRKKYWYEVRPETMSHSKGWYLHAHIFNLFGIITLAYVGDLLGFNGYKFLPCILFFLFAEISYYLYTAKHYGRFFPKSYKLWGFWTEERLFIGLGIIFIVASGLTYL